MNLRKFFNNSILLPAALILGVAAGYLDLPALNTGADVISEIFINLLKLVSLPIIFLSIVSTASGMESMRELKNMGQRVLKYTLLTTVIAATIALLLYMVIDPARTPLEAGVGVADQLEVNYFKYLIQVVPSNIVEPFSQNNVIGVLFIAMLLSLAILALPDENRTVLHTFFKSLYAAIMKVTSWIVRMMPLAIWAFITLFVRDLNGGMDMSNLALYLCVVVLANLVQAFVVLPLFLQSKGISPYKALRGMFPALSVAFFSKSSSAALPMAMKCAEERVGVSRKVAGFTLPLCTTINMNACAAFILTTVLFVSMSYGMTFSTVEMVVWIFVATAAAVGNAGVPMGCYFIASAFLAAMNVPLTLLAVILPFYTLIDMLETAINVWSDSCVTMMVQKDLDQEQEAVISEEVSVTA
ncbi:MAG: dicarboxylate/amino acid:cation symporter [Chlamydiales bacterium]|nr:dicarboxylate/amino acid:cation symporter [Chlamydiia bacterium]MCP5507312.1 dicarboxylate/amino acid:cation symporter [Chlamydiales bacterium]